MHLHCKSYQNIDTALVLVGKETKYSATIKTTLKNNISHKVIFLKGLTHKELAITYQLATVFVYPSILKVPNSIIEALFSKVPVITQ
jgi:glycosyltransferase involved in cell wall biosynthesis